MKCSKIKARFSDFLIGEIDEITRKEIQEHVTACDSCRQELESLSAMWTKLGVLPEEQPSNNIRTRFYGMLEKYKQGLEQEKARSSLRELLNGWLERWAPRRPVFQFSFALVLLVVGLAAGYFLHATLQRGGEIAQLRQEVQQIRQMAAVSLLQQESLSQQLREISGSSRMKQPYEESLAALLRSMDIETDIDLRPAGIDAFFLFRDYSMFRQEFVQTFAEQASPLVQIALTLAQHIKSF